MPSVKFAFEPKIGVSVPVIFKVPAAVNVIFPPVASKLPLHTTMAVESSNSPNILHC